MKFFNRIYNSLFKVLRGRTFYSLGTHVRFYPALSINRPELVSIGSGVRLYRGRIHVDDKCRYLGEPAVKIGDNVSLAEGFRIILCCLNEHDNPSVSIGNDVIASENITIMVRSKLDIGDYAGLGNDVSITDFTHTYEDPDVPIMLQKMTQGDPIKIGKGSWLGMHVRVFGGVEIGEHSVIGANAVVTHDIPAYSVAVGVPARVVKRYDFDSRQWVKCDSDGRGVL
ncbi:MAG: hypothetical protein DRG37_00965 [Deltaproteobacteria bacterium]|nr:MAG: hypothetical protein DRG37_00965 [Deltaproteobacteria bacterium]